MAPEDLPAIMTRASDDTFIDRALVKSHTLEELEKEYIRHILSQVKGNRSRTAEILGIDRKTLYRKLKNE